MGSALIPGGESASPRRPASELRRMDSVLEMGWLIAALLVPLWVNFWAHQPFELSKVLLLRSIVWVLTGLWLADWLLGGEDPRPHLRGHPLLVPVAILAAVLCLATVSAANPLLSLFGTATRGQGFLTVLSYLLLFLVVTARVHTWDQARRLVIAVVATAGAMVPLSMLQAMGWDPVGLISDARAPIYGTLGRANFVGAYLAMLVPLTLALAIIAVRGWRRRLLLLLLGAELVVVALSLARAAWLAAGSGVAVFGLLWVWGRSDRRERRLGGAVAVAVGVLGLGLGATVLLRAQSGSLAARRTIWVAVGQLVAARPLLGYGPDALAVFFPRVFPPQLVYYHGREFIVDRAHNLLLDWAVTLGVPGVLAILLVLAAFFALGYRRVAGASRRSGGGELTDRDILLAACLAAVAGNLAGNLVSFDVTATAMATWLLYALATSPAMGRETQIPSNSSHSIGQRPTPDSLRRLAAGLLVLGTVVAVVQLNGRPLLASVSHRTALRRLEIGDERAAVAAAQRAVALWPWEPEHHWLSAQLAWRQAQRADRSTVSWAAAEAALLTARDLRPEDYAAWVLLGDFYGALGAQVGPGAFEHAHRAYEQAASLAPNHARLYVAWGRIFLDEERPGPALALFRRAVDLDATDGLAFRLIGDVELSQGHPEAALAAYREAARWSPDAALVHLGLARTYAALDQPVAARGALDRARQLDPNHPAVRAVDEQLEPAQ